MPATTAKRTKSKGADPMGRVTTTALIENSDDLVLHRNGFIEASQARKIEVANALVDTGATLLSLPKKFIKQLGLRKFGERRVTTSVGVRTAGLYGPVLLTIQGRKLHRRCGRGAQFGPHLDWPSTAGVA